MSRLPQWWWTQRNAIRNANCKTSWIIKILNAHCALRICLSAYLFECPHTPLIPSYVMEMDYGIDKLQSELYLYWNVWPSKDYIIIENLCLLWWIVFICTDNLEIVWQRRFITMYSIVMSIYIFMYRRLIRVNDKLCNNNYLLIIMNLNLIRSQIK